jgi:hypothetical protein
MEGVAPPPRADGLIVERLNDELLVYDTQAGEAHQLAREAATVFELCDGRATTREMAAEASARLGEPVSAETVEQVTHQLAERRLLRQAPGLSRREAVRKAALAGAAVAGAAPLVKSIVLPASAQAFTSCTPGGLSCSDASECCDNSCIGAICCLPAGQPCSNDNQCCSFDCAGTCA